MLSVQLKALQSPCKFILLGTELPTRLHNAMMQKITSFFYLSEKLISYMELRNLIDKILLSAADLISLSAGVKRKVG
jgi:hypothetical protein